MRRRRDDAPGLGSSSSHGVTLLKAPDLEGFAAGSGGLSMRRGHLRHARRRAGHAGAKWQLRPVSGWLRVGPPARRCSGCIGIWAVFEIRRSRGGADKYW